VSLEAGGGIPCWPNQAATLLVSITLQKSRNKWHENSNICTVVHINNYGNAKSTKKQADGSEKIAE